jgi:hypothetical protein
MQYSKTMNPLKFIRNTSFIATILVGTPSLIWAAHGALAVMDKTPIDRHALVTRHNVVLTNADVSSPLSVGNGEFAFTADVTGLQTFDENYKDTIPLSTMSQWGFHAMPNPAGFSLEKFPLTTMDTSGRPVGYLYDENGKTSPEWHAAAGYLYANPSRLHLGRIALVLKTADGHEACLEDLKDIHQKLDLWTGELRSHFSLEGEPVEVSTSCHPDRELLAVQIRSTLIAKGRLSVLLAFPYGAGGFSGNGADWSRPTAYQTVMTLQDDHRADFVRTLDNDHYYAAMQWSKGNRLTPNGPHRFLLVGNTNVQMIEFVAAFSQSVLPANLPKSAATRLAAASMWKKFWSTGGAIDLSQSKDPRWKELERRIVLSQYLTRIQCCGSLPPQETGLTGNSWFGKFHLEMHWWHAAHFPLWGRSELLERSLPFYQRILPKAEAQARRQGYEGARWPKCVGPSGDPAPTYLECFLIWQQPHPIFYAELAYRSHPNRATLKQYQELVFETAKFMASYAAWDKDHSQYRLGPPFADAAEVYFADHEHQWNPTFEIAYWRWGLETAQNWRERLGLPREKKWDDVIAHLPPLPTRDGLYVAGETASDTFTTPGRNTSHPCMLAPLGMLDGSGVDRETMRRTLHKVMDNWDWNNTWGWDYPLMAMTAARLGEGETAIQLLLMDTGKNSYLVNGHNPQLGPTLPLYLPGNGGLLYATALMAAGWDGAPAGRPAPGFPDDGNWVVKWEGLEQAP